MTRRRDGGADPGDPEADDVAARGGTDAATPPGAGPLERARRRMVETGQWDDAQCMGRRFAIGCVALEITQRCNLDCSLCYLSADAEAVHDLPLTEVFRRIDAIRDAYGPGTDVQITGGDPTLRRRDELVAIVARAAARGLRPSLMTNGIRATRPLLAELAAAGLVDVVFHVDLSQRRAGYATERDLNAVRLAYAERAAGLGLAVMFNTTVFAANVAEIPDLAAFFVARSGAISLASFQLQADTGRGVDRGRPDAVTPEVVAGAIRAGARCGLSFDLPRAGHRKCNLYAMALVCNGKAHDFYDDRDAAIALLHGCASMTVGRGRVAPVVRAFAGWILARPALWAPALRLARRNLARMWRDLIASRGRVTKISFFIHDFMHACALDGERVEACAFMVATAAGPVSMCLHNAGRDAFVSAPFETPDPGGTTFWNPLTGRPQPDGRRTSAAPLPPKRLKGRARARAAGAATTPGEGG